MGPLAIPRWLAAIAWVIAGLIVALNAKLLFDAVAGQFG
jgi:manganese transport protein